MMAEMVAWLRDGKRTLLDELDAIHRRYGLFVSSQVNITRPGASGVAEIRAIMERLRAALTRARSARTRSPSSRDYEAQTRDDGWRAARSRALTLPKSNVLAFELDGGQPHHRAPERDGAEDQVLLRCPEPWSADGEAMEDAEARANATMAELSRLFVETAAPS